MRGSFFKRFGLLVCAGVYTAALLLLHAAGRFPAPGSYDLSHMAGSPALTIEGRVINFPMTRWGQTRFLLEGRAMPLSAFHGRTVVNLQFPFWDLAPGDAVRLRGWLSRPRGESRRRSFDERTYWASYGTYSVLRVWSPYAVERLEEEAPSYIRRFAKGAWEFHQRFKRFWFIHLPADEAAVLCCMTVGSRGILPKKIKDQCVRAGVYHILVVSGQNVALIIALGIGLLRLLGIPRRWTLWICCLPIVFYVHVVGGDPPVTRAACMAILILAMIALGRDIPSYYPLVLTGFWMILCEPAVLFGASFQLSFGATASLMAIRPVFQALARISSRPLRWLAQASSVSFAVYVGLWPILAYYFHQLSLAGFLANWTLFPVSAVIMVAGLVLGIWGVFSPEGVPPALIYALHRLLEGTLWAIERMSEWRWAAIAVPAPSWTVCCVYYGLLICILFKIRKNIYGKNSLDLSQGRGRL